MRKAIFVNNNDVRIIYAKDSNITILDDNYFDKKWSVSSIKVGTGLKLDIADNFPIYSGDKMKYFNGFLTEPKLIEIHKKIMNDEYVINLITPKKNQFLQFYGKILFCCDKCGNLIDFPRSEIKKIITNKKIEN